MYFQPNAIKNVSLVPDYSQDPFLSGFHLTITGSNTLTLSAGSARSYNSDFVISYNPFLSSSLPRELSLDISTTGVLGCYPTPIENYLFSDDTTFNVYVLGDSSGVNSPTAVVATGNNFLPNGYDKWRKVGSVYVDSVTRLLIGFVQSGNGVDRTYLFNTNIPGASYGPTSFFILPLSNGAGPCNPFFTTDVILWRRLTSANVTDFGAVTSIDLGNSPTQIISPSVGNVLSDQTMIPVGLANFGSQNLVYVTVSGAGALMNVSVLGWKESMGLGAI